MSYARFGWDGSDVYVFTSSQGIECCACVLQKYRWQNNPGSILGGYLKEVPPIIPKIFRSNAEMITHLGLHRAAGHTVPQHAFDRLADPADAEANLAIWDRYDREKP